MHQNRLDFCAGLHSAHVGHISDGSEMKTTNFRVGVSMGTGLNAAEMWFFKNKLAKKSIFFVRIFFKNNFFYCFLFVEVVAIVKLWLLPLKKYINQFNVIKSSNYDH